MHCVLKKIIWTYLNNIVYFELCKSYLLKSTLSQRSTVHLRYNFITKIQKYKFFEVPLKRMSLFSLSLTHVQHGDLFNITHQVLIALVLDFVEVLSTLKFLYPLFILLNHRQFYPCIRKLESLRYYLSIK